MSLLRDKPEEGVQAKKAVRARMRRARTSSQLAPFESDPFGLDSFGPRALELRILVF
jgi:hypothetical protein